MLFNSFEFLFGWVPLTLALYFGLARVGGGRFAIPSLAVCSLLFYAYWDPDWGRPTESGESAPFRPFSGWGHAGLVLLSVAFNFAAGRVIGQTRSRWLLSAAIGANLALLGWFKYADFGLQTWTAVTGLATEPLRWALPLGISFWTFTQIAFLCDAYRGAASEPGFFRYLLFVTFYPHGIAGPIIHHREMMPQFGNTRWVPDHVAAGLTIFTVGLAKKTLIADPIAPWSNALFDSQSAVTFIEAWIGLFAYTFQLYFDFSGYTDMAIGVSLLFNVRLPENFDSPYKAASPIEFWRRWHMTLSRWLRDYLYIPLGGNRVGPARQCANLFLTMLLAGLWHGAGWTFVAWGAYHGLLLTGNHVWRSTGWTLPLGIARPATFLAVMAGWVLFRSPSLERATAIYGALLGWGDRAFGPVQSAGGLAPFIVLPVLLAVVQGAPNTREWLEERRLTAWHAMACAALFCACLLAIRNVSLAFGQSQFIYFQF